MATISLTLGVGLVHGSLAKASWSQTFGKSWTVAVCALVRQHPWALVRHYLPPLKGPSRLERSSCCILGTDGQFDLGWRESQKPPWRGGACRSQGQTRGRRHPRLRRRLWRGTHGKQVLQQQGGERSGHTEPGGGGGLSPVTSISCPFTCVGLWAKSSSCVLTASRRKPDTQRGKLPKSA